MEKWKELRAILAQILGKDSVYYQPPPSIKMDYPAIVFSLNRINVRYANDKVYKKTKSYTVTFIDRRPDNPITEKLLDLPMCSFDRRYASDNLYHDVYTIYF